MDQHFSKTSSQHMTCSLVRSITNIWHEILTLESPSNSIVNTLGFSPRSPELHIPVTLMSDERLRPLFDDLRPVNRSYRHPAQNRVNTRRLIKEN